MFLILVECSVLAYGLVFTLLIYLVQRNDVERGREHAKVLSTKSAEMLSSQLGQHLAVTQALASTFSAELERAQDFDSFVATVNTGVQGAARTFPGLISLYRGGSAIPSTGRGQIYAISRIPQTSTLPRPARCG